MGEKVLVIGLDGADLRVIKRMVDEGLMPNISFLIERGWAGELKSTYPPITAPSWASFMSGKNPGKHGIFNFLQKEYRLYRHRLSNFESLDCDTLWEILNRYGKTSVVVGLPMTYPARKIQGIMLSGFPGQDKMKAIYPKELHLKLESKFGEYIIDIEPFYYITKGRIKEFLEDLSRATDKSGDVALYCLNRIRWDFSIVCFMGLDRLQHSLWDYIDEEIIFSHSGVKTEYQALIKNYFRCIDTNIGRILESVDRDTNIFIVSDHGFGPFYKHILINNWLQKNKFLEYRANIQPLKHLTSLLKSLGIDKNLFLQLTRFIGLRRINLDLRPYIFSSLIDWRKTRAFSCSHFDIYINLKGREPQGIVEFPEEYEDKREEIIEKLLELQDPESGERVIYRVSRREEIYAGKELESLPDLVITECREGYVPVWMGAYKDFDGSIFVEPNWLTGFHRLMGLLIVYGPGIKSNKAVDEVEIIDLFPTILSLFNIPLPEDIDGKVLDILK